MLRTHYCGNIRESNMKSSVKVCGWVNTKRDMGGIIFIDLHDREGTLQIVCDLEMLKDKFKIIEAVKNQSVLQVRGKIRLRDDETINPKIATGTVELYAEDCRLLSEASPLPFSLDEEVREDLRLKYRFLDIRREAMISNLKFRHKIQKLTQDYLDNDGFISVETPMLTKSTPEGARDYLVPSRVHPGEFYALPQSPQIFKQLLMVGGLDKYYQIARCFRDEDLRADRQPEFTQVDMEMSFVEQEDVLRHLEKLFKYIFKHSMNIEFDDRFPRITWKTAMDKYGSDKPDLRFDLPIVDITEVARVCEFSVFRNVVDQGGVVRAICIKGGDVLSRSQIDELTKTAVTFGAKGMAWISLRPDGEIYSILKKYFNESDIQAIIEKTEAKNGDFILFCADKLDIVRKVLGVLRLEIADIFNLRRKDDYKILFVTDFPQFEYSEEEGRYLAMHHPFTMPYLEDISLIETDKGAVRAQAYDVVLNGVELGSGSVRIYDADIQQKMFSALGFSEEEIKERFGFMVDAFKYGTPPHAGFAFGLDRLVMLLVGANSLREVIAFPKTKDASCLMTNAPNLVDDEQLEVLNLGLYTAEGIVKKKAKSNDVDVDVDKVAALAMLSIKEEEKEKLKDDLLSIIEFANQLKEADTSNIKPSTAEVTNVLRTDVVTNINRRDEMLSNAKTKENGMILIKKVIE
ncbi:aspartate--tRNA ligase [Candidatus Epulopiscium viviparus]|uniref:aspartate--tRNA ligase n=1 Tax=Candidatus Epulonipiscium viviparus TaxID=420336 RepID=UPI00273809F8|nr:aspartate--tRNA ligase [Candidatus Epulopiscium viviparus]